MEDKGAAASGVEVTGEGGKRTRGGENTESTCHWESQKSGNQKCCQKQHEIYRYIYKIYKSFEIFAFSVVTLLGCGLKQFLLFSAPPHALVWRSRVVIPQRVVLDATTWGSETLSSYLATT